MPTKKLLTGPIKSRKARNKSESSPPYLCLLRTMQDHGSLSYRHPTLHLTTSLSLSELASSLTGRSAGSLLCSSLFSFIARQLAYYDLCFIV